MPLLTFEKREGSFNGYHHSSALISYPNTDGVSDPLLIPPMPPASRVSVYASPASPTKDTVEVEFTLSPDADVIAGSADWQSWPEGAVAVSTTDTLLGPITGLRFKSTTTATPTSQGNFLVVI